ncbi:putative btb poz domain protein [Botrytis fragariae]|uniref:Putative btb poz domain protein n=1 Tax=Botrytis fragariae TaxID=1964551 RepID=A0A8H6ASH0_9HELO|nr:putative btb poz domain protein [Botrytis fragariae]KAF5872981.1 putative btb poz domain protein [Botrytis fragariae]
MESQLSNTSDALDAIKSLYETGKYADMKIRCEEKVFDVHRAVVCIRSPVIAAAMDDDRWEEAAKGEYHMSDEELPIVEVMIKYLYCGSYDDQVALESKASNDDSQVGLPSSPPKQVTGTLANPSSQPREIRWSDFARSGGSGLNTAFGQADPQVAPITKPSSLLFNAKVYIIADKYMIPALKSLAHEKFTKSLREHWNTPEFTASAEFLWENTPGSDMLLRRVLVATAATHIDVLLDRGEFVEFMSEHGDFAVGVMKKMKGRDDSVVATPNVDQGARNSGKRNVVVLPRHRYSIMEMVMRESDRSLSRESFANTENEEHTLIENLMESASVSRLSSAQGSLAHDEDEERDHVLRDENATMKTLAADFDRQSLGEESLPKVRRQHNIGMACKYCVLCQAQFPPFFSEISGINTFWKWRPKRQVQPWEYKFRAVIEINRDDEEEEDIGITGLMTFPEGDSQEKLVALIPSSSTEFLLNTVYSPDNPPYCEAFCFHDWCYSILRWRLGKYSDATLHKVCKSLSISPAWENIAESEACLYDQVVRNNLLSDMTELGPKYQPLFLSKLPLELRALIWGYVGPSSAYSSFMIVASETSRLFYKMHRPAQLALVLYPKSHLVPKMIRIFGTDYIQSLCAESTTIPITDSAIACSYKLAIGTHGICAIQIISEDGSSYWVGKVPASGLLWYVDAQRDFRRDVKLHYTFKQGLNIDVRKMQTFRDGIWDRVDSPKWSQGGSFLNYIRRDGYGLYRYIPFYSGYEYITGITIHYHKEFVTGMEAYYGKITELTGLYSGVALHLPLEFSERISYVWIKLEENRIQRYYDPAFIIQTTHGRTCHLGPYVPHDEYKFYQWNRLTFHGQITGICVENFEWTLKNFNIISDGNEVEPMQPLLHYETPKQRPYIYLPQNSKYGDYDLYFSSAKFSQMKRVTLCRINERCMGILIHYLFKPPVVLGQWYKPEVSSHQIIYDRSHPPPSKIMFRSARFENSEEGFVVDVSFTQEELPPIDMNDQVQVFDLALEQHIAWWFTNSTDLISLWNLGEESAQGVEMREIICRDHEIHTSNEQIDNTPDIFKNTAMEGENDHDMTPQSSTAVVGESRNDNEIVNSDFVTPYDGIDSPAENAVDEREEGPETFRAEHEMSGSQNEDEQEKENDGASVPLAYAQASEYCILCRARLFPFYFVNEPNRRRYQEWLSENPAEQWQLKTRAVMNLRLDDHESPVMTKVFMFDSLAVDTSLVGHPAYRRIVLDPRPDLDDYIDTSAHCFHDWCYSVLSWKTKQNSAKFLFELGRNLNTSTVWEKPAEWNGPLYPQIDINALLSTADDGFARLQPLFLSRLPVEIRSRIWSYVGSETAYSAFLALFNEVYDTEDIRASAQDTKSSGGIEILQTVTEIDIVSSVHGIYAIRFSGSSWTSEWLGRIPQTDHSWYGTIQVDDTNLLIYSHNVSFLDCSSLNEV